MRFAEHTAVSSERSKAEIEETLPDFNLDKMIGPAQPIKRAPGPRHPGEGTADMIRRLQA